jgi:hypothetical protein
VNRFVNRFVKQWIASNGHIIEYLAYIDVGTYV